MPIARSWFSRQLPFIIIYQMSIPRSLTRAPQLSVIQQLVRGSSLAAASRALPIGARWYSPVRSKVHMPPPPPRASRRGGRAQQQSQQQQEYYEPQVRYSYPEATQQPPTGGVIQYSDGIASLLEQPVLVMERQIEFMNVFLVCFMISSG